MDIFDLQPGDVLGSYKIIRTLGRGGMGSVYEAEHIRLGTRRALKVFATNAECVEFLAKRFLAEGRLLADLNHLRIVRVYDFEVNAETGTPYFAMDLVLSPSGQPRTLADECEDGEVTEEKADRWFLDICDGLGYIHSKGIVHRDLSLDNVLIGTDGHAVLADFGVAKMTGEYQRKLAVTKTMVMKNGKPLRMGKDLYMAPEMKAGAETTPATDAYALGVLLFRLLTGSWYTPETRLDDALAAFDGKWTAIIRQLCAKDPRDRLPLEIGDTPMECPKCGKRLKWDGVPADGQHIRCPICGCRFEIKDGEMRLLPEKKRTDKKRPVKRGKFADTMSIPSFPTGRIYSDPAAGSNAAESKTKTICRYALLMVAVIVLGVIVIRKENPSRPSVQVEDKVIAAPTPASVAAWAQDCVSEATSQKRTVQGISGGQGIGEQLREINYDYGRIKEYCGNRRQADAQKALARLTNNVAFVCRFNEERKSAHNVLEAVRETMRAANTDAIKTYATSNWNDAVRFYKDGLKQYDEGQFLKAKERLEKSRAAFGNCGRAAKENHEREQCEQAEHARVLKEIEDIEMAHLKAFGWTAAQTEIESLGETVKYAKAKELVKTKANRIRLMRGFRHWCAKETEGLPFKYDKKEARMERSNNAEVRFSCHKTIAKGRDVWPQQSCSWASFFANANAMLEQVMAKIVTNGLEPKIASDSERSSLLLGGALVADLFRADGDIAWKVKIREYALHAVSLDSQNKRYAAKWYPQDDVADAGGKLTPEPLPLDLIPETDYGLALYVKNKNDSKNMIRSDRGSVVFTWSPTNKVLTAADSADTIKFRLLFESTETGFRLARGSQNLVESIIQIFEKNEWGELPEAGHQMSRRELDEEWQCREFIDVQPEQVILVENTPGNIMIMKIGTILSVRGGDKEDSISFIYRIYKDKVRQ